jgi:predicted nuclease of predicted toxin-antitoxin system
MRILLDECLDWRLGRELPGHEVESVPQRGWAGDLTARLIVIRP